MDYAEWQGAYRRATMDDVVIRLRHMTMQDSAARVYQTMTHAADEIERLREEVRQLQAERDQWQRQAMSHD